MIQRSAMRLATLAVVFVLGAAPAVAIEPSGPGPWVVRAWFGDAAMAREVAAWGDHFSWSPEKGYLTLVADEETLGKLHDLGYFVELDEAANARLASVQAALARGWDQPESIPGFPCYRTVEETFAAAQSLAAAHPTLASVTDRGDSWEKVNLGSGGYDMMVLRLTNTAIAGPKPVFFATAAIHAREYTTAEGALRFAEKLVADYGKDPDATWLLDHHEFHLMLHTNPDGRKRAETGLSWRKNTNQTYCGATSSSRGADLNRNFDFHWGEWGGSSGDPCSSTYRGASAASEPETQAVQAYMAQVFLDQRPDDLTTPAPDTTTGVYVDVHSFSPAILGPWGLMAERSLCTGPNLTPNCDQILRLGRKLGQLSAWDPRAAGLYATDGATKDHAYGRYGVPAFTWEMGTDFFESCENFERSIVPVSDQMFRYALRVARTPYLEPQGPDTYRVTVLPGSVEAGDLVELTAMTTDGRSFDVDGTEPVQPIAAARAFLDVAPWQVGASPIALAAADGTFDSSNEAVVATIPTSGLPPGVHRLYVQAQDTAGFWGPVSAGFLAIANPASDPILQGTVLEQGSVGPLAATVAVGPYLIPTDSVDGSYSARVPAGTYDLVARSPFHAPRSVAGVVLPASGTVTENFLLPPPIFADDAEGANPGWTAQSPWAVRTDVAFGGTHSWSDSLNNYANSTSVSLTSPVLDLSAATEVELQFRQTYMIEAGQNFDFGRIEVSTNGGSNWTEITRYAGAVTWDWEQIVLPLPALDGVAQARFRFRLTSDSGENRDGWHLDDIALTGVVPTVVTHTMTASVTGSGLVTSNPVGISCPGDCDEAFPAGTPVTLTAAPDPGWSFAGWSGDCSGTGTCSVSMTGARSVGATFLVADSMPFLDGFESGDTSAWSATLP